MNKDDNMEEKRIEKMGCVIPYQVWDGIKGHNPATISEVIKLCVEYDRKWQKFQKEGLGGLGKMTPSAAMAFSFAKPLIDANNSRYFAKVYKNDDESTGNSDNEKPRAFYKKGGAKKQR